MASLCRANIFFCIIIVVIRNVSGYCNDTLNSLQCRYDVFCSHLFSTDHEMRYYRYENTEVGLYSTICKTITAREPNYGDNEFFPINLVYKTSSLMVTIVPEMQSDYERYKLALVTYLDLSNNNYEEIPEIKTMNNLAVLKLSSNFLTVAKLSNMYELPSLTEIDLSHNTISDVQYDTNNNIYRRLKKIDLSYNYLTKIESVFEEFKELETLDVSHNYIDTLSPNSFEGLKQLLYLNVSFNRISDINSSLFRFIELKLLDLSNNKIKEIKASDFNKLTNLVTLDLNSNALSIIEQGSFYNMPLLNSLYLNNNKLENIDKQAFDNLTSLFNIDISSNNLKMLPKGLFKDKRIIDFSIKDNKLEGSIKKGTFEGLLSVPKMDLSSQNLDSIEDYAFNGLGNIVELLLNNNKIKVLSSKCFRTIPTLQTLDLSYNRIENLDFEKDDLYNLFSLSLRNNHLTVVRQDNFHGLNSLQFLDLSDNRITQVEKNSFESLKELINFEISNNPLSGTLEENTFDGLTSLPSLDISCTLLSTIQNGSFNGMVQLKTLNVSNSKINTLEYNIFVHTGAVETLDFSFNKLEEFNINSTELAGLERLYLEYNNIKTLDLSTFRSIPRLLVLTLSRNMLQNLNANIFTNHKHLRILDVSFNLNLKYTLALLNETKSVSLLNLSGIKAGTSFGNLKDLSLVQLLISNSSVSDVKTLQLNELQHLDSLTLSSNDITKLETGGFNNITNLRFLDLSYNKITYIQPGVFKDNARLHLLNISHNFMTDISYGIFRGLIYLNTLDISYNNINNLQNERFYEVRSLSILIADHNKIESITADEFLGTSLSQLSIGENPLSCDVLVNLKRRDVPFKITATRLDENNHENIDGVTCNRKTHTFERTINVNNPTADNLKVLYDIRNVLLDYFNNHQNNTPPHNVEEKYIVNITEQIQTSNSDLNKKISTFLNSTTAVIDKSNETNILLNKILRVLTLNSATKAPPIQVTKDNATYENLLSYINKVRQELEETVKLDKNSMLNEIETRISAVSSHDNHHDMLHPTEMPQHEKLSGSAESKSMFTETCVALILIILVCFVLFKVYKSGVFVRKSFSVSTRELPGAMDSSL